jgi:hypothetical protein
MIYFKKTLKVVLVFVNIYTYTQLVVQVVLLGGELSSLFLVILKGSLFSRQGVQESGLFSQQLGVESFQFLTELLFLLQSLCGFSCLLFKFLEDNWFVISYLTRFLKFFHSTIKLIVVQLELFSNVAFHFSCTILN